MGSILKSIAGAAFLPERGMSRIPSRVESADGDQASIDLYNEYGKHIAVLENNLAGA